MAMKQRVKKTMAAGLGALLFFWYFSPAMAALRAMPQAVEPGTGFPSANSSCAGIFGCFR